MAIHAFTPESESSFVITDLLKDRKLGKATKRDGAWTFTPEQGVIFEAQDMGAVANFMRGKA